MHNFIVLTCPQCGGKLEVRSDATTLTCVHCGTECLVHRDAEGLLLERFAKCPVCLRNDKVEKITAIVKSQTHQTQGVTYESVTYSEETDGKVNVRSRLVPVKISSTEQSGLAQSLASPNQPPMPQMKSVTPPANLIMAIGSAVASVIGFVSMFIPIIGLDIICDFFVFVGGAILSIVLFVVQVPKEKQSRRIEAEKVREENQKIIENHQRELDAWKRAMTRYNLAYYCGRCDRVFTLGRKESSPVSELVKYLYQEEAG
jgi:predicted RNA-binding Zn-ribbon protein involved in translation (DUF1610 family)